ncbi:hypothetical protein L6452_44216 [Arctium lappa]|uniref:Uncharacterized protein n=1 Tax=Arctium lappa TaxID=4217 RepID=A0ACB8XGW3_ARCLA|nr:hypothetical protein L6452_44216 [Arctium lappa]
MEVGALMPKSEMDGLCGSPTVEREEGMSHKKRRRNHIAGNAWKGQGGSNSQDQDVRSVFNEKEKEKQMNKEEIRLSKEVGYGDINIEEVGPIEDMGRDAQWGYKSDAKFQQIAGRRGSRSIWEVDSNNWKNEFR